MEETRESIDALRRAWPASPGMSDREVAAIAALIREKDRSIRELTAERRSAGIVLAALMAAITLLAAFRAVWFWAQLGYGFMAASNAAAVAVYWIYHRRGRTRPDVATETHAYYEDLLRFYDRQARFLKSAKYWYVLPLLAGVMFVGLGIHIHAGDTLMALLVGVVVPVMAWLGIRYVNDVRLAGDLQARKEQLRDWLHEVGVSE